MEVAYKENVKLCKWQEQHISKLADVILKIQKIAETAYKTEDYLLGERFTDLVDDILRLIKESEV